jgi:hypothetical protein
MGRKRGRRSPRIGGGASLITGGLSPTLTPSTGDLGTRLRNGWHSSSMLSSPPEPADGGLFDDDDFDDRVDDHHDAHDAPPRSSDDPPHRPPGGGAPLGGGGGGGGPPMSGMLRGSRIPVIVQDLGDHSVGSTLGDSAEVRPTSGPTTIASSSSSLWRNIPIIVQDLDGQSVGSALGRAAGVDFDEDDDGAIVVVPVFGRRGRYTAGWRPGKLF